MKDLDTLVTRRGTPFIVIATRVLFAAYFIFTTWSLTQPQLFPNSALSVPWLGYLIAIYVISEYLYRLFRLKGIDLSVAFPLLFAVYVLNIVSVLLNGQSELPLINRAEHFASFVLVTYVIWVFFLKYLPHTVWHDHPYYTSILIFSVTAMLGVGNELIELFFDSAFVTSYVGEQFDTSLDLLMNSLGSFLFLSVWLITSAQE